MKFIQEDFSR